MCLIVPGQWSGRGGQVGQCLPRGPGARGQGQSLEWERGRRWPREALLEWSPTLPNTPLARGSYNRWGGRGRDPASDHQAIGGSFNPCFHFPVAWRRSSLSVEAPIFPQLLPITENCRVTHCGAVRPCFSAQDVYFKALNPNYSLKNN